MPLLDDAVLAGVDEAIEQAIEDPKEGAPPREALEALRADLPHLGLFGLLVAVSDAPPPDEAVHREQADQVRKRLAAGLADGGAADAADAPPAADDGASLGDLLARYSEAKSSHVTRRAIENALFDFYDLQDHGLFIDDVTKAFDVIGATRGETDDIKGFVRAATRLSGETAKFILGLFPEQIALIHRIAQRAAEPHEIERAFDDFGPRAIRKRLTGVVGTLIEKEKRFRLALTLWARSRGIPLERDHALGITKHLELKSLDKLLARAAERADARRALLDFAAAHPDVAALERYL